MNTNLALVPTDGRRHFRVDRFAALTARKSAEVTAIQDAKITVKSVA